MRYDPDVPPDAGQWTGLNETEQMALVADYHRRKKVRLDNQRLHATIHVIVENQILLGDETPVAETLKRLMREGLSRHDAVHAIGSVLAANIFDILKEEASDGDPNEAYFSEVAKLTAETWRSQGE